MNTLKKLKILLKLSALIGLVLSLGVLYLKDIVEKYEKKATTITTSREQLEFPTWPATTFCMQKPVKPSVMIAETGTPNRDIFRYKTIQIDKVLNQSLLDTFYKVAYKMNRDFELDLLDMTDSTINVIKAKVGENSISSKVKIIVEEFPTEMDGLCYSLTYRVKENTYPALFFGIIPQKELLDHPIDNPNGVTFFLTTENTRKNIVQRNWPYLTPQIIGKKFTLRNSAHIFFEETEFRFFNGNPNCQLGCLPTECLDPQDILANTTCPEKCLPIHLSNLYDATSIICNTIESNACMYSHYVKVKNQKLAVNCGPPASDIQYATFVKDDEFLAMENPQPAIFPRISPFSQTKLVKEEIRIYDDASIVAALGGFFGLFIGFSFYGSACFLIDKVVFSLCPNKV